MDSLTRIVLDQDQIGHVVENCVRARIRLDTLLRIVLDQDQIGQVEENFVRSGSDWTR